MAIFVDDHNGHPPPRAQFPHEVQRQAWRSPSAESECWLASDAAAGDYTSYWKGTRLFYGFTDPNTAFEYRLRFT